MTSRHLAPRLLRAALAVAAVCLVGRSHGADADADVDVFDTDIMLALTGRSHSSARLRLWRFKRDAADFLGVEIPKEVPDKPRQERPAKHHRVPDGVANHFIPWLIG